MAKKPYQIIGDMALDVTLYGTGFKDDNHKDRIIGEERIFGKNFL